MSEVGGVFRSRLSASSTGRQARTAAIEGSLGVSRPPTQRKFPMHGIRVFVRWSVCVSWGSIITQVTSLHLNYAHMCTQRHTRTQACTHMYFQSTDNNASQWFFQPSLVLFICPSLSVIAPSPFFSHSFFRAPMSHCPPL